MCAINPKFKKFFRLEFYTSHGDEETFNKLLAERLIWMEQAFNESGAIRVHINELVDDDAQAYEALKQCDDGRLDPTMTDRGEEHAP